MEIILLVLTPILYIWGLASFLLWLVRGGKTVKHITANDIRKLAARPDQVANTAYLQAIASFVESGQALPTGLAPGEPGAVLVPSQQLYGEITDTGGAAVASQVGTALTPVRAASGVTVMPTQAASVQSSGLQVDVGSAFRQMNNITMLLYLGAFMVVVSVGIFVGYNFSTLSGGIKTALVTLFSLAFYLSGLLLYRFSVALKPAGTTFSAVGLITLPLVGLAYYNFIPGAHDHAAAIWVVVSVVSLAMGGLTFALLRQEYITYFVALSLLSVTESSLHASTLPVYYLAWGVLLTSGILMLIARRTQAHPVIERPLSSMAFILTPLGGVMSVFYVADHGTIQLGITALLAAGYYELQNRLMPDAKIALALYGLSRTLVTGGVIILLLQHHSNQAVCALIMAAVGALMLVEAAYEHTAGHVQRHEIIALVGGLTVSLAAVFVLDQPAQLTLWVAVAAALNLAVGLLWRQVSNLLLGILGLLVLPAVAILNWITPSSQYIWASAAYAGVGLGLIGLRLMITTWRKDSIDAARIGYALALLAVLASAAAAGSATLLVMALVVAGIIYALSYVEARAEITILAAASGYLAAAQVVPLLDASTINYAYLFGLSGAVVYALGLADSRKTYLPTVGIIGAVLGALSGGLTSQHELAALVPLLLAAGMLAIEWTREHLDWQPEASAGLVVLVLIKLLWFGNITATAVYANVVAIYIAWLAYRRYQKAKKDEADLFAVGALSALIIPMGLQSLTSDGQITGLILTIESIGLVLVGMAWHHKITIQAAVATLIIEVLYQARTVLFALPKYVITALLGLALLGGAIWLLARRERPVE